MPDPRATAVAEQRDDLGLSIDMLDSDRLRKWADNIEQFGPDMTQWASAAFLVSKCREMADAIEQAVRDIGTLRAKQPSGEYADMIAELRQAASQCLFEVQCETWYGAAGNLFGRAADVIKAQSAALADAKREGMIEAAQIAATFAYDVGNRDGGDIAVLIRLRAQEHPRG